MQAFGLHFVSNVLIPKYCSLQEETYALFLKIWKLQDCEWEISGKPLNSPYIFTKRFD